MRYFSTDTLPAVDTFCVLIWPYCTGPISRREEITAHAAVPQADVRISFTSNRISSGVLLDHSGEPEAPLATLVTLVTVVLACVSIPLVPMVVSPMYTCSS